MRDGAALRVRFRVTVISSGAAQVDYVVTARRRAPDALPLQQFSATASWSFANHSGSLIDAWRVRARLRAARSATRSALEARDVGEPRDAVHAVYMTYDHSRLRQYTSDQGNPPRSYSCQSDLQDGALARGQPVRDAGWGGDRRMHSLRSMGPMVRLVGLVLS